MRHNSLPVGAPAFSEDRWSVSVRCGPNGGNCVQVNLALPKVIGVRDGKRPDAGDLVFGPEVWRAFLAAARLGRFDY